MANIDSEKMVSSIMKEKNIDAQKTLKKIIQDKCTKRIKEVLDN